MMKNTKIVVSARKEGKADKDRQESFANWSTKNKLEFDSDGKRRRARDAAENNRLL